MNVLMMRYRHDLHILQLCFIRRLTHLLFPPVMTAVEQWDGRVAAPQSSPQTVGTDAAVRGAGRDQCGPTGDNHVCCRR